MFLIHVKFHFNLVLKGCGLEAGEMAQFVRFCCSSLRVSIGFPAPTLNKPSNQPPTGTVTETKAYMRLPGQASPARLPVTAVCTQMHTHAHTEYTERYRLVVTCCFCGPKKKAYVASEAATHHCSNPASLHTHRSIFPEAAQENPLNDYILACGSNCSDNFSLMWRIGNKSAVSGN